MIVVLTLGRSGSSLLMQTLHALGCEVIGRKFDEHSDQGRQARHVELNPQGYFEEPGVYYGGPRSEVFQRYLRSQRGSTACKMDLRHLVDKDQSEAWQAAAAGISKLIISFREPSEQAHSEWLTRDESQLGSASAQKLAFVSSFLTEYRDIVGAIDAAMAGPLRPMVSKLQFVCFSEARDPDAYVERIRMVGGLEPQPEQISAAISNISPDLFRIRRDDLPAEELEWAETLGAQEAYQALLQKSRASG